MKRACLGQNTTEFASSAKLYTYEQKHASSIRPLKIYFVRMKYYYSLVLLVFSSFVLGQINPKDDLLNQINGHYSNQIRERLAVAFHSDSISPGGNLIMHILTGSINQNLQPSYSRNIYIRLYFQNGLFLKSLQYKSTGLYNQLTMPVDPEWPAGMYFAAFYTDRMQNEPANVVPVKSFYIGNPDIKNESSTKDTSTFLNQSKNQAIEMFVSLISDSLVFEVFNPLMRKGMIALIRTNSQIHWSSEVPNDVLTIIRQIKPFTVTSNKILFYGNSSINFPEGALIYIDNIPQGSSIGVLQSIAVYDIESIQVLTSVIETQMYTAFASGGIIDIRTKRGKQKNISEVLKNSDPASFIIPLPPKSSKIVSKYNKNSFPLIFIE